MECLGKQKYHHHSTKTAAVLPGIPVPDPAAEHPHQLTVRPNNQLGLLDHFSVAVPAALLRRVPRRCRITIRCYRHSGRVNTRLLRRGSSSSSPVARSWQREHERSRPERFDERQRGLERTKRLLGFVFHRLRRLLRLLTIGSPFADNLLANRKLLSSDEWLTRIRSRQPSPR